MRGFGNFCTILVIQIINNDFNKKVQKRLWLLFFLETDKKLTRNIFSAQLSHNCGALCILAELESQEAINEFTFRDILIV